MLKIVINSHIQSTLALDRLLNDLNACHPTQIPIDIVVVVGGYREQSTPYIETRKDNITWIHAQDNAIDFTGLLAVIDLFSQNTENVYMYLHDTCSVSKSFLHTIAAIDMKGSNTMRINSRVSMNMGLYRQSYLNTISDIEDLRGTGDTLYDKARGVYLEDWFFKRDPTCRTIGRGLTKVLPQSDVYGTGVLRITEIYSDIGLMKYKANWEAKSDGQYELRN